MDKFPGGPIGHERLWANSLVLPREIEELTVFARPTNLVDDNRQNNHDAGNQALRWFAGVCLCQTGTQDTDNQNAKEAANQIAPTTGQTRSANDGSGNRGQLDTTASAWPGGAQA